MTNMNFNDYEAKVIQWAEDRRIIPNATPASQLLKAVSEMGELADAVLKDKREDTIDAIGDVLVCLINLCALKCMTMTDCLAHAYEQIKDRNGTLLPNGTFVKDETPSGVDANIEEVNIEYEFKNTPPTWPHPAIITLKKKHTDRVLVYPHEIYSIGFNPYVIDTHKSREFIHGAGVRQIKAGLHTLGLSSQDIDWLAQQIWKEFLNELFPNGIPDIFKDDQ